MTSSRRHFVFFGVLFTHDHIFLTEEHFSFIFIMIKVNIRSVNFRSKNARACVRPRVSARAKNKNAPNRIKLILHTFEAILSVLQKKLARACARFFARTGICQHKIAEFSLSSYLAHFSKHFDTLFTFFCPLITE